MILAHQISSSDSFPSDLVLWIQLLEALDSFQLLMIAHLPFSLSLLVFKVASPVTTIAVVTASKLAGTIQTTFSGHGDENSARRERSSCAKKFLNVVFLGENFAKLLPVQNTHIIQKG